MKRSAPTYRFFFSPQISALCSSAVRRAVAAASSPVRRRSGLRAPPLTPRVRVLGSLLLIIPPSFLALELPNAYLDG